MRGLLVSMVCGLLISCGGGGGAGGSSGSAGVITLRVANTFLPGGMTTGPALDIYDDMFDTQPQPSLSGQPLIAGLEYGTISSYVKPRFVDLHGAAVRLTALPAGSSPSDTTDGREFWGTVDDGSHPQFTLLVMDDAPSVNTPLSGLSVSTYAEKGEDDMGNMGPLAPPPPAGQGEYLAGTEPTEEGAPAFTAPSGDYFFFVDDSCTPALNGDPQVPGVPLLFANGQSSFALFGASPGSHALSIVAWLDATTPTCDQLAGAKQGTTTVSVAAGQQIIAWVYGSSLSDLHLLTAPIAP